MIPSVRKFRFKGSVKIVREKLDKLEYGPLLPNLRELSIIELAFNSKDFFEFLADIFKG